MNQALWWEEEIRSFPCGGGEAVLWVVRRNGRDAQAPLHLLFWHVWSLTATGEADHVGMPIPVPPLNRLLRVLQTGEQEEREWDLEWRPAAIREPLADATVAPGVKELAECAEGHRLCVTPLTGSGDVTGALAIWYPAREPWREAVNLWTVRFAARLSPLLDCLPPCYPAPGYGRSPALAATCQPCLFPVEPWISRPATTECGGNGPSGLLLPRPLFVPDVPGAVGISRELHACCADVRNVATSGVNVLLCGESGTGKEIIAHAIHLGSARRDRPFLGQNCAALPEALFESELFGHKMGAFTGATGDKMGLLEATDGGTFFLDEIGDMPQVLQIKLLRVMQERRIRRIGELKSRPVDIRFIAATHKDLHQEVAAGRFRLDLYYRLKVVKLSIPSLRQRPEDITHLLAYFLRRHGGSRSRRRITERALTALHAYSWPGNVRELENDVCRMLALYPDEPVIQLEHLSEEARGSRFKSRRPDQITRTKLTGYRIGGPFFFVME